MEVKVLERLPNPIILKKLMKIQASLNMILCQDEWLRYHSFIQDWDEGVVKTVTSWHKGKVEISEGESDGSDFLLGCIYQTPEEFVAFAADYFELPLSLDAIVKIYDDFAITEDLIRLINPHCDVKDVLHELKDLKARA